MSTFESDLEDNSNLDNVMFGMCGYGSGRSEPRSSKAKSTPLARSRRHVATL